MPVRVPIDRERISGFCRKWGIVELCFFGSVLRDDFGPHSDVDVLITFAPDVKHTLFDWVHMRDELQAILDRPVDLVERSSVEQSDNYIRRKHILKNLEPVYVNAQSPHP